MTVRVLRSYLAATSAIFRRGSLPETRVVRGVPSPLSGPRACDSPWRPSPVRCWHSRGPHRRGISFEGRKWRKSSLAGSQQCERRSKRHSCRLVRSCRTERACRCTSPGDAAGPGRGVPFRVGLRLSARHDAGGCLPTGRHRHVLARRRAERGGRPAPLAITAARARVRDLRQGRARGRWPGSAGRLRPGRCPRRRCRAG
jgi:hypothetical protein